MTSTSARMALRATAVFYATGTIVHTIDHLRRGTSTVTHHVFWAGMLGTILAAGAIALVFAGPELARRAAALVGFPHGIGIAAVHFLPHWSVFSDGFPGAAPALGITGLSWLAASWEVAGAITFAIAGLY